MSDLIPPGPADTPKPRDPCDRCYATDWRRSNVPGKFFCGNCGDLHGAVERSDDPRQGDFL